MFKLYNSLIFSLIFIFGLCGFALSQVKASFSDEIATLGNTVTASIWEVVAEPDWSQMGVNTTVIQGGETYLIQNLIFNSGFENDLDSWTYGGEIKSLSAEDSLAINPKIGLMMAQIGSIDDESSLITTNFLSQELTFLDSSPQALSFWYNLVSYEHLMGFDEPAFSVYLNRV